MPVEILVEPVGNFRKLADKTIIPNIELTRLNEDPELNGLLKSPLDISRGHENFRDEYGGDGLHSLFDYLKKTSKRGESLKDRVNADFISNRRTFVLIGSREGRPPTLGNNRGFDDFLAVRQKGVIFLKRKETSEIYRSPVYGPGPFKFRQYLTLNENGEVRDVDEPVSNAESEKVVFRTRLTKENRPLTVFYAAVNKAVDSAGRNVEMKLTKHNKEERLQGHPKVHFLQALLGKVSYIIYGKVEFDQYAYSQEWTHVEQIYKIKTEDLPRENRRLWSAEYQLEFLHDTLQAIKDRLKNDGDVVLVKVREVVEFEEARQEECTFLDQDFLDYFS